MKRLVDVTVISPGGMFLQFPVIRWSGNRATTQVGLVYFIGSISIMRFLLRLWARERGGVGLSFGGDHSRWRKATFMKFLGLLMSRRHSENQTNNNTYFDWTKCTVKLSLLASPTRSELNSDLAFDDRNATRCSKIQMWRNCINSTAGLRERCHFDPKFLRKNNW